MNRPVTRPHSRQRGMALITSLLLLLVVTILGVGMFRSFGLQERIAGNTREKQRAVQTAGSAQAYAEWWLSSSGGVNATSGITCAGGLVNANAGNGEVCSNKLTAMVANVAVVPWLIGGTEAAVTYTPPTLAVGTDLVNVYFASPRFYISFLTGSYDATSGAQQNTYQIDAVGYGGTSNAVAVVESGYTVGKIYTTQNNKSKEINLGGP